MDRPPPLRPPAQEALAAGRGGLVAALGKGQRIGINGGDIDDHVNHALWFAAHWPVETPPATVVDLGSGGGIPGLVLATVWPTSTVYLAETRGKRAEFLQAAVHSLGWRDRVTVIGGDVQSYGQNAGRNRASMVSARAFGPPAYVAECAAPLLMAGGYLVVSEPPSSDDRWPTDELASVGLRLVASNEDPAPDAPKFVVMEKSGPTPEHLPRRRKRMDDQPLF